MKETVIPIVMVKLGTVTKVLLKTLEELEIKVQEKNIQTTVSLGSAGILRRVLEIAVVQTLEEDHLLTLVW